MSYDSLALKYRPRTFRDIVGQTPVQLPLYRMLHDKEGNPLDPPKIPHALLFTGDRGSGKTSTARIVGAALNCEAGCRRPCGVCPSCLAVQSGGSLDIIEIDAASAGGVAEIRKIKNRVSYLPTGQYKVVILDEAHSMSTEAFNALLKVLEEPPENTVFILVTTDVSAILPTVYSRCMKFQFRRITPQVITERLRLICTTENLPADDDLLYAIAQRAEGGLRDAIMLLDQVTRVGVSTLKHLEVMLGETDYAPAMVTAMASGSPARLFGIVETVVSETGDCGAISRALISCLRDVLVLSSGGPVTALGDALAARQALSNYVSDDRVVAAMRVLWDLRRTSGIDTRSSLDLALVMCMDKLHPKTASNGHGTNGHAHLGVDEMRRLASL
jgi:DNA polymerase-3 subunit gamma/tau